MKNQILLIALFLPLMSFAQRQGFVIPLDDNISINLPSGVDCYAMENNRDTLLVKLGLGQVFIFDQEISFNTYKNVSNIRIEQQLEYCLTISDEGPHIDLRNWLVGYTPWLSVPRSCEKYKIWAKPQEKPSPTKPEFDVNSNEFLKAIEATGFEGEHWQKAAQNPHSLSWGGSRLLLKVCWEDNGASMQKIIVLKLPMGC